MYSISQKDCVKLLFKFFFKFIKAWHNDKKHNCKYKIEKYKCSMTQPLDIVHTPSEIITDVKHNYRRISPDIIQNYAWVYYDFRLYIAELCARTSLLKYIIGENHSRLADDISPAADDLSHSFGRSPFIYNQFIGLKICVYHRIIV